MAYLTAQEQFLAESTNWKIRFDGDINMLRHVVALTGDEGDWHQPAEGHWQFRNRTGAVLNFWPSTQTVFVQGRESAALRFRVRFLTVRGLSRNNSGVPHA